MNRFLFHWRLINDPFISKQLGRKPLFLTGLGVMITTFALSAGFIVIFDLEGSSPEEVNKVASYFTLVFLCFNLAGFISTCG